MNESEVALDALAAMVPLGVDPKGAPYGSRLFDNHATKLCSSGITAEVAAERGYVSADTKAQILREGFGPAQACAPALVIPIHDVLGQRAGAQLRPDHPRMLKGKPAKYETRAGQRMLLDVPPRVRPRLGDPEVPLVVTEGPLKADAAASAGMACIALLGVWNWRGSTPEGGTVMLPDWENIALKGRRVVIAFDSDASLKENVAEAMKRLAAALSRRGANVGFVYLPPTAAGEKVGLDDWLAVTGNTTSSFWSTVVPELRRPSEEAEPEDAYDDVEEEDGVDLLDDLVDFLTRYVAFPSIEQADAVALWALHSHAVPAFESTPRLVVLSPEKGSGKTRVLEVLHLVCRRAKHSTNMSAAYMFRSIEVTTPTLLVDEVDTIFGPRDKNHEELRGLINAGHRRGATVGRMVGEGAAMEPKDFPVFCPVALAGIGQIPDTILDRSVLVRMRKRAPGEKVEQFRSRWVRSEGEWLRRRSAAWAVRNLDDLSIAEPPMPEGLVDRAADVWEPLIAVADHAGGSWPERARRAAVALNAARQEEDPSLGVKLLEDIRTIMKPDKGAPLDRIASAELVEQLVKLEESPWADLWGKPLDARGLARRLKAYEVVPKVIRVSADQTPRGYELTAFYDAWTRYLPPGPPGGATTATPQHDPSGTATSTATATPNATDTPPLTCDVADVAVVEPLSGDRKGGEYDVALPVADNGHVADVGPQRLVFDLEPEGIGR